jgi:hypothetical protein
MYGLADAYVGYGKSANTFKQTRVGEADMPHPSWAFAARKIWAAVTKPTSMSRWAFRSTPATATFPVEPGLHASVLGGPVGQLGRGHLRRQYTPLFRLTWRPDPFGVNTVFSPVTLWAQADAQAGLLAWRHAPTTP